MGAGTRRGTRCDVRVSCCRHLRMLITSFDDGCNCYKRVYNSVEKDKRKEGQVRGENSGKNRSRGYGSSPRFTQTDVIQNMAL